MGSDIMLYIGAIIVTIWGIAHIVMTGPVIKGFEPISQDNKRVITMEWVAEGITLCFIGLLVLLITILDGSQNYVSTLVYRASAVVLIIMAVLSSFTGARTPHIPYKLCPPIFVIVAILFILTTVP
jgi:hypothetical protein